jgi:predicted small integral membrane protein
MTSQIKPAALAAPTVPRWAALGSLPVVIAVLVGLNAVYLMVAAFGNISDFATNQAFVHHVLAMDTTNFGARAGTELDPNVMWRAVTAVPLLDIAYVCIIAWEVLAGLVLATAFVSWIVERGTCYPRARALSTIGLMMIMLLFAGGFIDVGGEWFQMWKSTTWNGLDTALRVIVLASLPLLLTHLPAPTWQHGNDALTQHRRGGDVHPQQQKVDTD